MSQNDADQTDQEGEALEAGEIPDLRDLDQQRVAKDKLAGGKVKLVQAVWEDD